MSTDSEDRSGSGASRRAVLLGGAAVVAAAALGRPGPVAAAAQRVVRRTGRTVQVGAYDITALLDASGAFGKAGDLFSGATAEDWHRARAVDPGAFGRDDAWLLDFRCWLVRGPRDHVTLVDTGVGPEGGPASGWAPVPGRLVGALAEVGVAPADVDVVVLSHLHEDHYSGSVSADGTPVFPNARYVVQQQEIETLDPADPALSYVVDPLRSSGQLDPVAGEARLARPGGAAAGIRLLPTPGHTVGHQSVLVEGAGRRVILAGDVLVHAVQLVNPGVAYRFESDAEQARETRHAVLELARRTGARLGTAHLHVPFVDVD